jgi:hypothetical protein
MRLLILLEEFSRVYPDMRLGQLIVNLSNGGTHKVDWVYDAEDEELLAGGLGHLARRGSGLVESEQPGSVNGAAIHATSETTVP